MRTAHLPGGFRAFNGLEPTVHLYPPGLDGRQVSFKTREFGALYADLAANDLLPIGFEFMSNSLEAKGLVPKNWRTYHPWGKGNIWPCDDQSDLWSQIGYAASKEGNAELWDVARRLSHQLRVCAWRLYQLSDAYHSQLEVRIAGKDLKPGLRFEDGFTWLGYLAIQSFLVDACILRDYLAEFFVAYVCPAEHRPADHIATMAGAKKHVLNKVASADPLFAELSTATAKGGWLFILGAYRDLCVHCVPLARSDSKLYAIGTPFNVRGVESLTGISLPLPQDPSSIASARASPKRAERLAEELKLLTSATRGEVSTMDALIYCYSALDQLTRLSTKLQPHSPTAPQIPVITAADVIGEIKIRHV